MANKARGWPRVTRPPSLAVFALAPLFGVGGGRRRPVMSDACKGPLGLSQPAGLTNRAGRQNSLSRAARGQPVPAALIHYSGTRAAAVATAAFGLLDWRAAQVQVCCASGWPRARRSGQDVASAPAAPTSRPPSTSLEEGKDAPTGPADQRRKIMRPRISAACRVCFKFNVEPAEFCADFNGWRHDGRALLLPLDPVA